MGPDVEGGGPHVRREPRYAAFFGGLTLVGAVLAVTLDPIWWVLVIGLAGRFVYLLYLLNQRRRRQEEERSTVAP